VTAFWDHALSATAQYGLSVHLERFIFALHTREDLLEEATDPASGVTPAADPIGKESGDGTPSYKPLVPVRSVCKPL